MRALHRSTGALLAALALTLVATSAGCGHCRDACRTYEADRAAARGLGARPDDPTPHMIVSLTEEVVRRAATQFTAAMGEELQRRFPVLEMGGLGRLTTHADLILDDLGFLDSPDGAAVRLEVRLNLYTTVRSVMMFRAGVEGTAIVDVALRPETSDRSTSLTLHGGDSRLVGLSLAPTGLMGMGASPEVVASRLDRGVAEAFQAGLLRTLANIELITIRDLSVGATGIRLFVTDVHTDADGEQLWVSLQTDLPIEGATPPPQVAAEPGRADLVLAVSPELAGPMLAAALAGGDGARFDDEGAPDPDGDLGLLVRSLTPEEQGFSFVYRAYRFARPCLVADFEGTATLGIEGDTPVVAVTRNELVSATRYEAQVRDRQPPIGQMSRRLTEMLTAALVQESVSPAPGLDLRMTPTLLRVDDRGFTVAWRIE
jgi:hypothetical protein